MWPRCRWVAVLALSGVLAVPACRSGPEELVLKRFSCDTLEGVIQQVGVRLDGKIRKEGRGSLRFDAAEPQVLSLFETGDIDVENAALIYQARLKTERVQGRVYLEMWCHFEGKGEFFSRGLDASLGGTAKWTRLETPFFLKVGENPDSVKLNIVCEGSGTVWVDDVRVIKRSLE